MILCRIAIRFVKKNHRFFHSSANLCTTICKWRLLLLSFRNGRDESSEGRKSRSSTRQPEDLSRSGKNWQFCVFGHKYCIINVLNSVIHQRAGRPLKSWQFCVFGHKHCIKVSHPPDSQKTFQDLAILFHWVGTSANNVRSVRTNCVNLISFITIELKIPICI